MSHLIRNKKSSEEDINNMIGRLNKKIFDIHTLNNKTYYLDRELNLIWDDNLHVCGLILNSNLIFWSIIDNIIDAIKLNNLEVIEIVNYINNNT